MVTTYLSACILALNAILHTTIATTPETSSTGAIMSFPAASTTSPLYGSEYAHQKLYPQHALPLNLKKQTNTETWEVTTPSYTGFQGELTAILVLPFDETYRTQCKQEPPGENPFINDRTFYTEH